MTTRMQPMPWAPMCRVLTADVVDQASRHIDNLCNLSEEHLVLLWQQMPTSPIADLVDDPATTAASVDANVHHAQMSGGLGRGTQDRREEHGAAVGGDPLTVHVDA
ncbi:hypothetical protein M409DRAFT_50003 [Zasmidium cellare ATCC 36951]|uniref:Uncharacterized protein n=1 Tax=Zasmidium cellare ATCC 36951 TaxID=1080233 RepID=A0A6A6CZU6_ZASCE|nr:uncharacterized protein M409DRAFT_50003 [Zasmidium cellare ATCC 36951]KAF2172283.1 hypothetical protein M409DRAFT_50003 [Zasmidium cellare ATCC 36951]